LSPPLACQSRVVSAPATMRQCARRLGRLSRRCRASLAASRKPPFTQAELDAEIAAAKQAQEDETNEADLHFIKLLVRAYMPAQCSALHLAEGDTLERYMARKRDTFDEILKRAQLCSPTIRRRHRRWRRCRRRWRWRRSFRCRQCRLVECRFGWSQSRHAHQVNNRLSIFSDFIQCGWKILAPDVCTVLAPLLKCFTVVAILHQ
jgi:hypothetical protein